MAFWKPGTTQPSKNEPQKIGSANSSSSKNVGTIARPTSANSAGSEKPILSKSVLSMKFMKRKEESIISEKEERIKFEKINNSSWIDENQQASMQIEEDTEDNTESVLKCTVDVGDVFSALPGRRSFGGFNKAVEKHYAQMIDHKRFEKASKPESTGADNDEEMLLRYETLVGLPRGPNQGVRQDAKPSKYPHKAAGGAAAEKSAPYVSKNKSLHLNDSHGMEMEEITHFEDRSGSGKNKTGGDSFKRKNINQQASQAHANKKKFKR